MQFRSAEVPPLSDILSLVSNLDLAVKEFCVDPGLKQQSLLRRTTWDSGNLEDRNLLKLRSLNSSCPFFLSDNSIWGQ